MEAIAIDEDEDEVEFGEALSNAVSPCMLC